MRSSVSAILSGSAPEQSMSYPDYQQTPNDHQSLLVVVRHVGRQLRTKQFNRAFDRISHIDQVKILDSQSTYRNIYIRYLRSYPVENNDWGDFQIHRKVLGLISIGQCNSQEELNELCRIHESLKVKYAWTLYDSRCVLFGLNADGSLYDDGGGDDDDGSPTSVEEATVEEGLDLKSPDLKAQEISEDDESSSTRSLSLSVTGEKYLSPDNASIDTSSGPSSLTTPTNFKARPLYYPTMEQSQNLERDIEEFVGALFWILESKRLDKLGLRKADRSLLLSTLCAPFEKKDFVGLDLESKNNKRRADGRLKKQLGDLTLQAGLPQESIIHYNSAVEILKSVNDWLWLAGALEGVCSASVCISYPQIRTQPAMQRNSSLQMEVKKLHVLAPSDDTNTSVKNTTKNLTQLELLEKYRECVTHYGKYRQAGIIETEASIKAALVLIEQGQVLHAADFLQNAVFISLQLTEEEKMLRFNALSSLYTRLGFHRKAAFFKRVAAMRCVSPSNPQPNWNLCHSLLLQLLAGYSLSLNPNEAQRFGYYGWPRLQIQILQELVGTAKRKGNAGLATRHMTLLLFTMLPHLSRDEKKEFALQLELISKESEGLPIPIVLENGLIIPPVHLSNVPIMRTFRLVPPTPHMRPEQKPAADASEPSPFFYTFLPLTSREKVNAAKDATKADFSWVEGELIEVSVLLENPLPIELRLSKVTLTTSGLNFQPNSSQISIPADSTTQITLSGTPLAPGSLRLLGYSTTTLGVKSNIRLKNYTYPFIDVEIVPSLPSLEISTSKPRSDFFSSFSDSIISSASINILMGAIEECNVTLSNIGQVPVEFIELTLTKIEKSMFSWSDENLQAQLPIPAGGSASFTLYVYGVGDFIGQKVKEEEAVSVSLEIGPSSLPSRLGMISDKFKMRGGEAVSNRSSSIKSGSSSNSYGRTQPSLQSNTKTYEALLKVKYSGGPGLASGHFRSCGIALNVEVAPSLFITKWDTLPGESPSQFYLVLDICNATQHEMELQYTKTKQILIEKLETCRIPVPVERCLVDVERGQEEPSASAHIINNVDLKWSLLESQGKATLDGIRLTQPMVQHVIVSPIQWEITVNGSSPSSEELHFNPGDMINIGIWLKNHKNNALEDILLSLHCFQDYQNGRFNHRLESRLAVIGNDAVLIGEIPPGSTFQHSLSLVFFVSGLYKLDFKCDSSTTVDDSVEHLAKYNPPLDILIN